MTEPRYDALGVGPGHVPNGLRDARTPLILAASPGARRTPIHPPPIRQASDNSPLPAGLHPRNLTSMAAAEHRQAGQRATTNIAAAADVAHGNGVCLNARQMLLWFLGDKRETKLVCGVLIG